VGGAKTPSIPLAGGGCVRVFGERVKRWLGRKASKSPRRVSSVRHHVGGLVGSLKAPDRRQKKKRLIAQRRDEIYAGKKAPKKARKSTRPQQKDEVWGRKPVRTQERKGKITAYSRKHPPVSRRPKSNARSQRMEDQGSGSKQSNGGGESYLTNG